MYSPYVFQFDENSYYIIAIVNFKNVAEHTYEFVICREKQEYVMNVMNIFDVK